MTSLVMRALHNSPSGGGSGSGQSGRDEAHGDELRFRVQADEEVLDEFCSYQLLELRHSDQTARGYLQQLSAVARQLDKKIVEVTPKDIRYEVKRDESVAQSTIRLRITAYRQLHMWALLEEKKWANTAMLGVKSPPEKRRLAQPPLPLYSARTLLTNCRGPNELRVVYFGLYGGLRVGESAIITHANVHGDRLIFIGKGDKERTVPIHPELGKVLPEILSVTPMSKGVLMGRMNAMRKRLRVFDVKGRPATTHSLRRTCADYLYDKAEVPREVVKMLLGHGSEVTDVYAPVRFGKMRKAIDALNYFSGEPVQLVLF